MLRMMRPTGGSCWVHELRLEEYIKAGYKPAFSPAVKEPKKAPAKAAKPKAK